MTRAPWQVIIVGAGPVGLLLGNLLGANGLQTLVIDKRACGPNASMAIGLTPPSLALLGLLQLDHKFVETGVKVDQAIVHGDRRLLGTLSFRELPGPYPFILSLPQVATVAMLAARLQEWPHVRLQRVTELVDLEQDAEGVTAILRVGSDQKLAKERCSFLVGADGGRSCVRQLAGIAVASRNYPQKFVMADVTDRTGFGNQAHLFFTRDGSVESFPLPGKTRRWIVQTDQLFDPVPPGFLNNIVSQRTGIDLSGCEQLFVNAFEVGSLLAQRYDAGRIVLCGDAAHLMSPVGGQGMNVGFGDAARLTTALCNIFHLDQSSFREMALYSADRKPTAALAISRAGRGMAFGTRRGLFTCLWRGLAIKILLSPPMLSLLPPYFAMLTLPGWTLPDAKGPKQP